MAQAARYLFDLDFSAPPEPEIEELVEEIPPEPMITVAEHEMLLEQVRAQAFAQGEEKALNDRETLASEQVARTQDALLQEIAMVYTEVGHLMARLEKDASKLAFSFASRFAEKLVAQEPKAEILALLHQVLAPLRKTPHIAIRLNPEITEEISQHIDEQMQALGFEGKLSLLPDEAMMPGDCEVEWADGGIGRNLRAAIRKAEQLLDDHFAHIPDEHDPEEEEAELAAEAEAEAQAQEEAAQEQDDAPAEAEASDNSDQSDPHGEGDQPDVTSDLSTPQELEDGAEETAITSDTSQDNPDLSAPLSMAPENQASEPAQDTEFTPSADAEKTEPASPASNAPETGGEEA